MIFNNKLILEPYQSSGKVEAKVSSGFAMVKQKSTLIGLKCLMSTQVMANEKMSIEVTKGQIVYFPEEVLHTSDWSKKTYDCDAVEGKFIIAESFHAVFVK